MFSLSVEVEWWSKNPIFKMLENHADLPQEICYREIEKRKNVLSSWAKKLRDTVLLWAIEISSEAWNQLLQQFPSNTDEISAVFLFKATV